MKRVTLKVFDQFPHAWDLNEVLRSAGVDSKIVSKHAVQIDPEDLELAKQVCRKEKTRRSAGIGVVAA